MKRFVLFFILLIFAAPAHAQLNYYQQQSLYLQQQSNNIQQQQLNEQRQEFQEQQLNEENQEIKVNDALKNSHTYIPQDRPMADAYNSRDEKVYQELLKKFGIKK